MIVECKWCGQEFEAQRSTAKFCSDRCKTANHRFKPEKEIEYHVAAIYEHLNALSNMLHGGKYKSVHMDVAEAIYGIKGAMNYYTPSPRTWWRDERTGRKVQGTVPGKHHVYDDDKWHILHE